MDFILQITGIHTAPNSHLSAQGRDSNDRPSSLPGTLNPLRVLSMLLLETHPSLGFGPSSTGPHRAVRVPTLAGRSPMMGVATAEVINAYDMEDTPKVSRRVDWESAVQSDDEEEELTKVGPSIKEMLYLEGPKSLTDAASVFALRGIRVYRKSSAPDGTRTHVQVMVRGDEEGQNMSLRMAKHVLPCHQDISCLRPNHPLVNEAIDVVSRELKMYQDLSAYNDQTRKGFLRGVQISIENFTSKVQLAFVVNGVRTDADPAFIPFVDRLWDRYGPAHSQANSTLSLHSIWVNFNHMPGSQFSMDGDGYWKLLCAGEDRLVGGQGVATIKISKGFVIQDRAMGVNAVLPPHVLRRNNVHLADSILKQVYNLVPPESRVVVWNAGVGDIGLALAQSSEWVRCSSIDKPLKAYEGSWAYLGPEAQARITYRDGSIEEQIEDAQGADIGIADPGRKGLDEKLLDALTARDEEDDDGARPCGALRKFIYLSTNLATLTRDMDRLVRSGKWRVQGNEVSAHVLCRDENRIEMVVPFERREPNDPRAWPMVPLDEALQILKANEKESEEDQLPRWKRADTPRGRRLARNVARSKAKKEEKRRLALSWTSQYRKAKSDKHARKVRDKDW